MKPSKTISLIFAALTLFPVTAFANPLRTNERLALRAMRQLHGAQMTYAAAFGNGQYGNLAEISQSRLIDLVLGSGIKYGYKFTVSRSFATATSPASFIANASPLTYRKSGRYSFYVDPAGEIHGSDHGGEPASAFDPIIDDCTNGGIAENEACTIMSIRTLHGAEMTCAATSGQGSYCSLANLAAVGLIAPSLASGQLRGYSFTLSFSATQFSITLAPLQYGNTGIRSFFIDESGVIRAADKHGEPADQNDPPL